MKTVLELILSELHYLRDMDRTKNRNLNNDLYERIKYYEIKLIKFNSAKETV